MVVSLLLLLVDFFLVFVTFLSPSFVGSGFKEASSETFLWADLKKRYWLGLGNNESVLFLALLVFGWEIRDEDEVASSTLELNGTANSGSQVRPTRTRSMSSSAELSPVFLERVEY